MKLSKEQLDELIGECKTPRDVETLYSQILQLIKKRQVAHVPFG